jgi:serine/threonine protein kinase
MTSVGDYDLEHQVGAGASGTVWKAHWRGPVSRVVALKRLRAGGGADDLARIRREATVLSELDHPHVVRVLEVIHDGDGVALAMQFAPGGSLADLLAERGRLAPGEMVAVAAPIAEALASAHRRGVLHGDVKPANVLFTSDGEPLLTDFGVSRTLGQHTSDQITGTVEYLAPELLDGAQPDPRADIYSLAVVCYQALAGRPPHTGPVPLAVARAAEAGLHPRLDEVAGVAGSLARVVEPSPCGRTRSTWPRQRPADGVMAYIAFASAKGSPGVTTAIAALAATWPVERDLWWSSSTPL